MGSKLLPECMTRSHAEAYHQLRNTLGHKSNDVHSFDITGREYRTSRFICATEMQKIIEAGCIGTNTMQGDILNTRFENESPIATDYATSTHIVIHCDNILLVKSSCVEVEN